MEDKELWATFEKTGNVLDYLNYKNINVGEIAIESGSKSDGNDSVRSSYR